MINRSGGKKKKIIITDFSMTSSHSFPPKQGGGGACFGVVGVFWAFFNVNFLEDVNLGGRENK